MAKNQVLLKHEGGPELSQEMSEDASAALLGQAFQELKILVVNSFENWMALQINVSY